MVDEGALPLLGHPLRTCLGCRQRQPKRCLVRLTVADGAVVVDTGQRLPGRGTYLCGRRECAQRVLRDGRRLVRALRAEGDHVTVDGRALLQDWETAATRGEHLGGGGACTVEEEDGRRRRARSGSGPQEMARE